MAHEYTLRLTRKELDYLAEDLKFTLNSAQARLKQPNLEKLGGDYKKTQDVVSTCRSILGQIQLTQVHLTPTDCKIIKELLAGKELERAGLNWYWVHGGPARAGAIRKMIGLGLIGMIVEKPISPIMITQATGKLTEQGMWTAIAAGLVV